MCTISIGVLKLDTKKYRPLQQGDRRIVKHILVKKKIVISFRRKNQDALPLHESQKKKHTSKTAFLQPNGNN